MPDLLTAADFARLRRTLAADQLPGLVARIEVAYRARIGAETIGDDDIIAATLVGGQEPSEAADLAVVRAAIQVRESGYDPMWLDVLAARITEAAAGGRP